MAPNGRSEPLADAVARVDGGRIESMGANAPKGSPPAALAGLQKGEVMFAGGLASKEKAMAAFGVEFVDVHVHRLTPEVRLPRIVSAFAAGTIMNPIRPAARLWGA